MATPLLIAFTRAVPPAITRCELTHLDRDPIDPARAVAQHGRYEEALAALGCTVRRLAPEPGLPDSVFVEDAAFVLPEVAVLARPGAASRRAEVASVAEALRPYRRLAAVEAPGTLDGGDVLAVGDRLYIGRSARTNDEAIQQVRALVAPFGYTVVAVPVTGCLHLKTAVTLVADGTVLLNPAWVDPAPFDGLTCIPVSPAESFAANAVRVGDAVLFPSAFPHTRRRLEDAGLAVRTVDASELAKAEAGLTCCSLLVQV